MQQYYQIESGSGTLTVFHTADTVSFDIEHFGGYSFSSQKLLDFLNDDEVKLQAEIEDPYSENTIRCGYLLKNGQELTVHIDGRRETTAHLSSDQVETLKNSISVGQVERYDDGQYPVESVGRDGTSERADHD